MRSVANEEERFAFLKTGDVDDFLILLVRKEFLDGTLEHAVLERDVAETLHADAECKLQRIFKETP